MNPVIVDRFHGPRSDLLKHDLLLFLRRIYNIAHSISFKQVRPVFVEGDHGISGSLRTSSVGPKDGLLPRHRVTGVDTKVRSSSYLGSLVSLLGV